MEDHKFQPMLAASEIPEYNQLHYPLMASLKLDGIRSPQVNGRAMSRKMLPIPNKHYQEWCGDHAKALHGLDGEGIVGLPFAEHDDDDVFNRSTRGLMKAEGKPDFTFYVFEDWQSGDPALTRSQNIAQRVKEAGIPEMKLLTQQIVFNQAALKSLYEQALAAKYEGLILKNLRHKYKNGRSTIMEGTLLKFKEWVTDDCRILEVLQGTTNTNPDIKDELGHAKRSTAKAGKIPNGTVGSFMVQNCKTGLIFKCGTGPLKAPELKALWEDRQTLIGRIFRYKYQRSGTLIKPRFPGFVGFVNLMDIEDPVY